MSGRDGAELQETYGLFINVLPLRLALRSRGAPARSWSSWRAETLMDGLEHQALAFDRIVENLEPARHSGRNPYFDATFQVREDYFEKNLFAGLEWRDLGRLRRRAKVDFGVAMVLLRPAPAAAAPCAPTSNMRTSSSTAKPWSCCSKAGISSSPNGPRRPAPKSPRQPGRARAGAARPEAPDRRAGTAPWPPAAARRRWGAAWPSFSPRSPPRYPDRPALAFDDPEHDAGLDWPQRQLDYRQLEIVSRRVAARLREAGARPGDFVAVCLERSLEQLLVFLAIVRAGAAYVPLDPSYPEARRRDMLADSGAALLILVPRPRASSPNGPTPPSSRWTTLLARRRPAESPSCRSSATPSCRPT